MHWLIDLGVAMAMSTFFFDLLANDPLIAWAVAVVIVFYLMNMFNEMMEAYTGHPAW